MTTSKPAARTNSSRALGAFIWLYKGATVNRRPACRFTPSCSAFALEALERYGVRRALPLIARRLVRCRPGGPFGYDPVPDELPDELSRSRGRGFGSRRAREAAE